MKINDILVEFAPAGGGGSGDYLRALASAWYNGTFDTGSLQKGIKSQEDVERLLNRGIVCPDGKTRKLHIDYNSDFDGVEIYSDDYYEYGDHDDTIDSRTGQPWGPYDFMAFSDEDLSEGLNEFAADDGDSGRWYTDDQMTDLVGDGWWQDMDVSGANIGVPDSEVPKAYMIQQAQRWLKRQGHDVQVVNVKLNDDDMEWYIEGAFPKDLTEFAPGDSGDSGEDDVLRKYARMWWNGDDATQQKIEAALARMGWEIGEDEGGYDNGGVFVVRAGDENGKSYTSWPAEDLAMDEGVWDTVKQIPKKANAWLDSPIKGMNSKHAGHAVQGAVSGMTHGHAVGHAMADTGVHEDSTAHDCKHCNGKGYHTVTKKDGTKVATNCPQCKGKGYIVTKGMAEGVRTESAELAKQYGWAYNQGEYGASMTHPKHGRISLSSPVTSRSGDTAVEREWTHNNASGIGDRSLAQHLQSLKEQGVAEGSLDEKSTSQAQFRTMAAAAHDPEFARKVGIKQSVAREFNRADKGQDYKSLPKKADEGAPVTVTPGSNEPGGAVDNFKQQMANNTERDMAEGNRKSEPPEADYSDDYQDMVKRVKKLAGLGPLKTQYDPNKRVYRNMPTAVQPRK